MLPTTPVVLLIGLSTITNAIINWHQHVQGKLDKHYHPSQLTYSEATQALQQQFRRAARPPLVWVPGYTSSNLTYSLENSTNPVTPTCPKTTASPQQLWPPPAFNTTEEFLCWLDAYVLLYMPDKTRKNPYNGIVENEEVDVLDMGSFAGTALWYLEYLYQPYGYKVGKDLFNVPFDWRYPLDGLVKFYASLKNMIESAYTQNHNRKVVLMAVSWGPQAALGFLHRMSQDWKDTYIALFVAESPLWSGSPSAVVSAVSGYGADPAAAGFTRLCSVLAASMVNLLPRAGATNVTWDKHTPIVETPSKTYTAYDMAQLYEDLGFDYATMVQHVEAASDLADFAPPGVDTLVTYGYNLPTPASFEWDQDFIANSSVTPPLPNVTNYDPQTGDTLVPLRSALRSMHDWTEPMKQSGHQLVHKAYANQTHASCVLPRPYNNDGCFEDVLKFIFKNT